eukprot:994797_1
MPEPTPKPSNAPTRAPSALPTVPTNDPSDTPTLNPTTEPTVVPTQEPTIEPTVVPTTNPSNPSSYPSVNPSSNPTANPTANPSTTPSKQSSNPTRNPTANPSSNPSVNPSLNPSSNPITTNPSSNPSSNPTANPSSNPTANPSSNPSSNPSVNPSSNPTAFPVFSSTWLNDSSSKTETSLDNDVIVAVSVIAPIILCIIIVYWFMQKKKADNATDMMSADVAKQESVPGPGIHINKWTTDDVYGYLSTVNGGSLVDLAKLFKAEEVRGRALFTITDDDLFRMGVSLGVRMEFRALQTDLVKQFEEGAKQGEEEEMEHKVDPQNNIAITTKWLIGKTRAHRVVKKNEFEDMYIKRENKKGDTTTGHSTKGDRTEETPTDAV